MPPYLLEGRKLMKTLSIDIETFSSTELAKSGVYRYASAPDFEILLFGYSADGEAVQVINLANGERIPEEIEKAIKSPDVVKWAFNANFERICLSRHFMSWLEPDSWRCSMVWSAYMGLPLSLEGVGIVLGLEKQKMTEGKSLIKYFCIPCAPTKANGGRTRNLPIHDREKWELFRSYNKRDVETEMAIQEKLSKFPVPDFVWDEYHLDQEINDRGIGIDREFVEKAIEIDKEVKAVLIDRLQKLTEVENPNSVMQLKEWLTANGLEIDSLGKKEVTELIKTAPEGIIEVLRLRQLISRSSIKKYQAMANAVCHDGRAHGMFQFYGANRTGRFSGRLIQLQNLPQNHMQDLAEARELVRQGNLDALNLLYDNIPDTLSQLIRTAFIPRDGMKFIVADFSAIEARVLSFLAGEKWRMDVFAGNGDIYCASASAMFKVNVVKHGENGHLRQKGKIAELALGYGGSVGALKAMGALDMGLEEEELQPLVTAWRNTNPNIVRFWWAVDAAVKNAVKSKVPSEVNGIGFSCRSGMLFLTLPSGRVLSYVKPKMGTNKFGTESVTYEGIGLAKKWDRLESYGPKFVENIVQAISRDILMYAMGTLRNCRIVAHVHDEVIIECDKAVSVDAVCEQMGRTPPWIKGLLLKADGYETNFYRKD